MNLRVRIGSLVLGILAAFWAAHVLAEDPPAAPVADEAADEEAVADEADESTDPAASDGSSDSSAIDTDDSATSDEAAADTDDDDATVVEETVVEEEPAEESDDEAEAEPEGPNAGLADLDKATQLKINAESLPDLNDVIDKIDSALEKGLDKDNQKFANELLVSSLLQRASVLSAAVLDRPVDLRRDIRAMQVRQFAVNDLQRVFELDPNIWESHLLMGRLQALPVGDPKTAKRELTKVIDAQDATPEDQAQAYAVRGTLQTDEQKQVADFDAAVKLLPYKPDYYRLRAQYLLGQDKYDAALADVNKALELEPDHAMTQELQGMVLLGLKRFDEASEAFKKASELAPEAVHPYQQLGEVYRQQGDLKKSADELTKALEIKPDDAATLLMRASLYYQLKDNEAALKDAAAAIEAQPQLLVAHLLQAEILVAENRIDEAIANLEKLVPLTPNQSRLLEPLATFYLVGGQPRKSIETFTKVLEVEPDNFRALRFRGDANLNIGNHAAAVADFNEALKLDGEDEGLLNNFAWVLATSPEDNVRDGKRALELATKAAEMSSHSVPHILSTLAAAYAETGDFENAKKWSTKAVELGENDETRDQLAKELESYEADKPWREKQEQEDKKPAPSTNDHTSTPPAETKEPADKLEL